MPLFHIHGLIAALLAPLSAGGEVYCSTGFNALKFFGWMDEVQAHLVHRRADDASGDPARARRERGLIENHRLRFIRSSSSSLPPTVIARARARLRRSVIEAYGMTEAAHQMASNPLPPRAAQARHRRTVPQARRFASSTTTGTPARRARPARS